MAINAAAVKVSSFSSLACASVSAAVGSHTSPIQRLRRPAIVRLYVLSTVLVKPYAPPFVSQRVLEVVTVVDTPDRRITPYHGSGAIHGDSIATKKTTPYEQQIEQCLDNTANRCMITKCPFTDVSVDVSNTLFIEDVFHVIILDRCRAAHAVETVARFDTSLDTLLAQIETSQNHHKLEFCGALIGRDSHALRRLLIQLRMILF